jgi:hypothetical protein
VIDGCALAVATGYDDGVGTLLGHRSKSVFKEVLGLGVGTAGNGVGSNQGSIGDAFSSDFVTSEGSLETVRGRGSDDGSLIIVSAIITNHVE